MECDCEYFEHAVADKEHLLWGQLQNLILSTSSEEHRLREFSTKTHAYVYNCLSSLHVVELTTREIRDPYFLSPEEVRCWPLTPT